jgi:hypothetical protein
VPGAIVTWIIQKSRALLQNESALSLSVIDFKHRVLYFCKMGTTKPVDEEAATYEETQDIAKSAKPTVFRHFSMHY